MTRRARLIGKTIGVRRGMAWSTIGKALDRKDQRHILRHRPDIMMTLVTLDRGMLACQSVFGLCMIEQRCRRPLDAGMTRLALPSQGFPMLVGMTGYAFRLKPKKCRVRG